MNQEEGYTVAEGMVALFIFGLIISLMLPLFQMIQDDANDQSDLAESGQWASEQMEKLATSCKTDRQGIMRSRLPQTGTIVRMKWACKKIDQWLIQVSVEVQWRTRKGETKKQKFKTHRFRISKGLPI